MNTKHLTTTLVLLAAIASAPGATAWDGQADARECGGNLTVDCYWADMDQYCLLWTQWGTPVGTFTICVPKETRG